MKSSILGSAAAFFAGVALAMPTPTAGEKRAATTFCEQWGSLETGGYIVYNNLWGRDAATSGSQCTTVDGVSGSGQLAWSTEWSWAGGQYQVKSYANAVRRMTPVRLSAVSNIPSTWSWSYTGSGMVANVAYDLFTASTPDGAPEYEIMIWLGSLGGAGPISETGSTIATPAVSGVTWDLYYGSHSQMKVYSFVARSNQKRFDGDLMDFVNYLVDSQGLSTSQYLQSAGAGTEPFLGSNAKFTTSAYSLTVN
ncbi:hypothetical protein DL771_005136 [Monosporascus sp. 5C6A]|nr:hypothetical protein DL771_005136 [Monosporascus sp. 5C6A]